MNPTAVSASPLLQLALLSIEVEAKRAKQGIQE